MKPKLSNFEIANHRNGIAGNGFTVIKFTETDGREKRQMFAVVFEDPGSVAVFDLNLLAEGNIKFGENSWRGDIYEKQLRAAITAEQYGKVVT